MTEMEAQDVDEAFVKCWIYLRASQDYTECSVAFAISYESLLVVLRNRSLGSELHDWNETAGRGWGVLLNVEL